MSTTNFTSPTNYNTESSNTVESKNVDDTSSTSSIEPSSVTVTGDDEGTYHTDTDASGLTGTFYTEHRSCQEEEDYDYDIDKNRLHELIDVKYWEEVIKILENPDEKNMARTPFPNREGDYPLHAVCDFVDLCEMGDNGGEGVLVFQPPPVELIKLLLNVYPEAAKRRGQNGCLPLHLASKRKLPKEIIELLIRAFPPALDVQDNFGYTPRDYVHNDIITSSMVDRPVSCWYQQIKEDRIADAMKGELKDLESEIESLSKEVAISLQEEQQIKVKLFSTEEDLAKLVDYSHGKNIEHNIDTFDERFELETKEVADRLTNLLNTMQAKNYKNLKECKYMKDFNEDLLDLHADLDSCMDVCKSEIDEIRCTVGVI